MDAERWRRIKELFEAARHLEDGEARREFLVARCGGDDSLRAEVESLLVAGDEADELLGTLEPRQHAAGSGLPTATDSSDLAPTGSFEGPSVPPPVDRLLTSRPRPFDMPEVIGNYQIVRKLGEGGMGVVFEARQTHPVQRRVALKLIKPGMDTERVIARFETERQALAMMSHENIARVLDAGTTDDGRPYFVMEYVAGIPITDYSDKHKLNTDERLDLFAEVCEGVHHAHQKGVIHRDLKPSNILVEIVDDRPRPKIIDFGVAKATSQRLTEQSMFTEFGMMVGTPEYMSPEQAEMTELDIDTRTDIYSLGVVLYEMLTGSLPLDSRELRRAGYQAILERIRDEIPSKPSTRLTTANEASRRVAESRRADLGSLIRELEGDLDWITMKAIEKDRTRRYSSVSELADDLRRHRKDEPVLAGPPRLSYRMRKFVRRHRVAVLVAATFVGMLILGMVGTTVGLVQAGVERDRARFEADTSREVIEFMLGVFDRDNFAVPPEEVTARQVLDHGKERVRLGLTERPRLQSRVMETIGLVYRSLDLDDDALDLLEEALEIRQRELGPDHPDVASSCNTIAGLHIRRADIESAAPYVERALDIQDRSLPPDHLERARTLNNLGAIEARRRSFDRALELWQQALEIREKSLGPNHVDVAKQLGNLGLLYAQTGEPDLARVAMERAIRIREREQSSEHPDLAKLLQKRSVQLTKEGSFDAALETADRALAIQAKLLGPDSLRVAYTQVARGGALLGEGDLPRARDAFTAALRIHEHHSGPSSKRSVQVRGKLIGTLEGLEANERLVPLLETQIHALQARDGEDASSLVAPLRSLARAHRALGSERQAQSYEQQARGIAGEEGDET